MDYVLYTGIINTGEDLVCQVVSGISTFDMYTGTHCTYFIPSTFIREGKRDLFITPMS